MTFEATDGNGYSFSGWDGDYFDVDPAGSIEVEGPTSIIAVFARPAPNDDIANAIDLASASEFTFDTNSATNAADDPDTAPPARAARRFGSSTRRPTTER